MSLTREVPVRSLFHSSRPLTPLSAAKKSVPLTLISRVGDELPLPGRMSLTREVPVRSLFHSSRPLTPLSAAKKSVPLTSASAEGAESPETLMSLTRWADNRHRPSRRSTQGRARRELVGPRARGGERIRSWYHGVC